MGTTEHQTKPEVKRITLKADVPLEMKDIVLLELERVLIVHGATEYEVFEDNGDDPDGSSLHSPE